MICGSCSVGFEDYAASSGLEDLAVTLNLAVTQYALSSTRTTRPRDARPVIFTTHHGLI